MLCLWSLIELINKLFHKKHTSYLISAEVSEAAASHRFPTKFKSAGQLNIHAVYLHILGDALGSVIVILSALIIIFAEGE